MFFWSPLSDDKRYWRKALQLRDYKRRDYDLGDAIQHLKQASMANPDEWRYHFDLGRTYMVVPELALIRGVNVQFKLDESLPMAIQEFDTVVKYQPKFDATYLNLAHMYVILEQKDKALSTYTEYLKLRKQKLEFADDRLQNLEYALMKKRKKIFDTEKAELHLQQAAKNRDSGKYKRASKELAKAYAVAPDFTWVYKRLYKLGRKLT
ncbi:MAG: hypothetical protein Q8P44_08380 [Dehalococcoidia bacterium]|nr:hypothetical protein [Dehalococcoidia bacterium]